MRRHVPRRLHRSPRHRRRGPLDTLLSLGFFCLGVAAFCTAVTLPTPSLFSATPATMVTTPPTFDSMTLSNVGGLLVIAATAVAIGVVLATIASTRPSR